MSKAIYFCDYPFDGTPELELEMLKEKLSYYGIEDIGSFAVTTVPPFAGFSCAQKYDVLFFDWGGMSVGNSCLGSFCRIILREAEDYPNRIYVMVSALTVAAIQDAMGRLSSDLPNLFLTISDFAEYYKTVWKSC